MKGITVLAIAIFILALSDAKAQTVDFGVTSSPNIVGSGARALGVGGAFIAIADDATAASWNPAALIILERPELALMGSYENRDMMGEASFYDFNYIAISYPFTAFQRNMIVSFNYQRLFDFNSEFERTFHGLVPPSLTPSTPVFQFRDTWSDPPREWNVYTLDASRVVVDSITLSDKVTGDIGAVAPAFAVQITPQLSLGFTLNFWMDGLVNDGYRKTYHETQTGSHQLDTVIWFDTNDDGEIDFREWSDLNGDTLPDDGEGEVISSPGTPRSFFINTTMETKYDFFGVNANIGALWNITPKITVGAVYKLPFTARMKVDFVYDRNFTREGYDPDITHQEFSSDYEISFPAVYGVGFAYRFNDNFTTALDISYTEWGNFKIKEKIKTGLKSPLNGPFGFGGDDLYAPGPTRSAVNGLNTSGYMDMRDPSNPVWRSGVDIDGVWTARLGLEYLFILPKTIIPVRAGFVYDPEPSLRKPDEYYAITAGTGIVLFDRYIFDTAYQYRWCDSATLATVTNGDGTILYGEETGSVKQHMFLLSTIVHF